MRLARSSASSAHCRWSAEIRPYSPAVPQARPSAPAMAPGMPPAPKQRPIRPRQARRPRRRPMPNAASKMRSRHSSGYSFRMRLLLRFPVSL